MTKRKRLNATEQAIWASAYSAAFVHDFYASLSIFGGNMAIRAHCDDRRWVRSAPCFTTSGCWLLRRVYGRVAAHGAHMTRRDIAAMRLRTLDRAALAMSLAYCRVTAVNAPRGVYACTLAEPLRFGGDVSREVRRAYDRARHEMEEGRKMVPERLEIRRILRARLALYLRALLREETVMIQAGHYRGAEKRRPLRHRALWELAPPHEVPR